MTTAVILHAHPDDELLFAGALMLSKPDWDWRTVSLTAGRRYPGLTLGFPDEWRILHRREYVEWRDAVKGLNLWPDVVVTHNAMGEYGHPHHMAVHAIAHELFDEVWDFYVDVPSSVAVQVKLDETWGVPVTFAKQELFEATYPGVYDELVADKPEFMARLFEVEQFTRAVQ